MFYNAVMGLPDRKAFQDFVLKMWSSAQDDRFAMLFLQISTCEGKPSSCVLSDFVQKVIRRQEYILSACQVEQDSFLILSDLQRLPLIQLSDRLTSDLSAFVTQEKRTNYYDCIIRVGIGLASHDLHSLEEWENKAKTAASAAALQRNDKPVAVMFYRESMSASHQENSILPLFDSVLSHHHLLIYLQPKYQLGQSSPVGAEALVRIMNANGRLLDPASFLPILEKYELESQLDLMVMESVLKALHTWKESGMSLLPVSINLSSQAFTSPDFMDIFGKIMEKYENIRHYLGFEINADDYYSNMNYMTSIIPMLHDLGCTVSLDGLGGDALRLSQLEIPSVDMVKLHRHFLHTGMKNDNNRILFTKIAEIFKICNIPALCEGIETAAEDDFIRKCGISYAQGFYYGRPVPLDIFEKKYMIPQPAYLSFQAQ